MKSRSLKSRNHRRADRSASYRVDAARTAGPIETEAHEIVRAISEGEVDAVIVMDKQRERVVSLADFGTLSELREVVRAIRHGEVDAFLMNEGGQERVYTLASIERALRESESRFREMAESMPCIVFSANQNGVPDYFNAAWWAFTGLDQSKLESFDLTRVLQGEDKQRFETAWDDSIRKGHSFETELPFFGRDQQEPCWHLLKMVPLSDGSNGNHNQRRWFGICTDIDRMKRAELKLAKQRAMLQEVANTRTQQLEESQSRLRVSERMAVLGTLSAGIGHDITNLLFPMTAHLDALDHATLPEAPRASVQTLRMLVDHLRQLVRGIRTFTIDPFQDPGERSTKLASWWNDTEPLLSITAPKSIKVKSSIPTDLPHIALTAAALTQVVFNLVHNSVQALGNSPKGVIEVWAKRDQRDPHFVLVGVTDNGPGMSEQTKQRCLEPFFTTKAQSNSTGLGLALVNQIVGQASGAGGGGSIDIQSQTGRGTTVTLRVPAAPMR